MVFKQHFKLCFVTSLKSTLSMINKNMIDVALIRFYGNSIFFAIVYFLYTFYMYILAVEIFAASVFRVTMFARTSSGIEHFHGRFWISFTLTQLNGSCL